jgi:hypothetical protein
MACNFVCFVYNQSTTRQGQERVIVGRHAISLFKNYLGVQGALRKLRLAGGTCWPGTWAGAPLFNEAEFGAMVLTSQEKWDRLKAICQHWF